MSRSFYVIFITLIFSQLVKNVTSLEDYHNEIHQGVCTGRQLVNEDLIKSGAEYTTKRLTYKWTAHSLYSITCINLYNKNSSSQVAYTKILNGGLGHSQITLELMTQNGKGLYYHLDIYANLNQNDS